MKKVLLFLVLGFVSVTSYSQTPTTKIQNYLDKNKDTYELSSGDVANWVVESTSNSKATKITNYYINQTFQGIEVFGTNSNVWYKNDEVLDVKLQFVSNIAGKVNSISPNLDVLAGLNYAHIALGEEQVQHEVVEQKGNTKYVISNGVLEDNVNAKLVFQQVQNELKLAWHYEFYSQDYKHLWSVRIDALNGDLLEKFDGVLTCNFGDTNHKNHNHNSFFFTKKLFREDNANSSLEIQSGSYRVFPYYTESPNHGSRILVTNPHDVNASPYGWHDTNGADGAEYTITRGNNVLAQEDINGDNGAGVSPNGTASLMFDFAYGGTGVAADTYTDAATTNLFYMNNIMHDVWYQYGFDEPNGNFQQNNYGNGGTTSFFGDYVFADSQDGSGTNNANFSTPSDGNRPRMQMYLWDVGPTPRNLVINTPIAISGEYYVADNVFDPGHVDLPALPGLTTDLVLYEDATPDITDGCEVPTNAAAMAGKIVILRRGTCPFTQKVLNAQNAGAAAVIVVNNDTANPDIYVGMSGADATITIPAVFVTYNIGEAIIAAMGSETVNVTLRNEPITFVNSDGDFDNVVIAHEYGHGISTRLTGGPATSCLNNEEQMGEGWSDFFGLMMQMKASDQPEDVKGIGTFVVNQSTNGTGIRTYPYSTDMGINPFTFADSNTEVVPHGVGSVWASMLWDLAWAYVDKYGFDPDIYYGTGGNNKVMQLVLDGLKLQGCSPTFITGRDALIAADQATTGGQDYCMIWEVFARRGLGQNASSGSANSSTDQVEDFTVPPAGPNCTLATNYFDNEELIRIYPNPSNGMLNLRVNNYFGELTVEMFDLNGRRVLSNIDGNFSVEKSLNISSLQSGVYLLKLTGKDLSYTQKVIKN